MSTDHIRYDLLVREALRGVVRRVVADVARNGLPGDHHFYIAFDTKAPGVRISQRLREQYPDEMTIVLQHQFWDLAATDAGIEVGLSFGGVPEKLFVPFEAIKGFFDPSVQFGLEFEVATERVEPAPGERSTGDDAASPAPLPAPAPQPSAPARKSGERRSRKTPETAPATSLQGDAPPAGDPEPPKLDGGAEVVRLDRFRKK